MFLIFRRTGERRYAVEVKRPPFPDLEMNPAPGYDPLIPHDLMHLVVEAQLGIKRGVFGQLAAGGDAGTFHPVFKAGQATRETRRIRNRQRVRGEARLREGGKDSAQSERATCICWYEWLARSRSANQKAEAKHMIKEVRQTRELSLPKELRALQGKLDEICRHLDELSSFWSNLEIGEAIEVSWPELSVVKY